MNNRRASIKATVSWRNEVEVRIAALDNYRHLLEEARKSARSIGGPEGERLEVHVKDMIKRISKQINDLRTSLE
jgi:hypothetical protein